MIGGSKRAPKARIKQQKSASKSADVSGYEACDEGRATSPQRGKIELGPLRPQTEE